MGYMAYLLQEILITRQKPKNYSNITPDHNQKARECNLIIFLNNI